jgi:hypothetical protein
MDEVDEVEPIESAPNDTDDAAVTADDTAGTADGGAESASADSDQPLANRLDAIVESLLFAAGAPVPLRRLVDILHGPSVAEVKASLRRLTDAYETGARGVRVLQVAGGFQMRTAPENADGYVPSCASGRRGSGGRRWRRWRSWPTSSRRRGRRSRRFAASTPTVR